MTQNTGISTELKRRLLPRLIARYGFRCHYCGIPLEQNGLNGYNPRGVSFDHVIPKIHGGTDTEDNLVLACRRCNNQKRTQSYEEFAYSMAINAVQLAILEMGE